MEDLLFAKSRLFLSIGPTKHFALALLTVSPRNNKEKIKQTTSLGSKIVVLTEVCILYTTFYYVGSTKGGGGGGRVGGKGGTTFVTVKQ